MKKAAHIVLLLFCVTISTALCVAPSSAVAADKKFSKSEIETLVSPIALYPDPLLQQVLPAATFPDQIADAALLIRTKADAELIPDQNWDSSVKVIAGYPGVLKMMYEKLDWTSDLGNAFLAQSSVVLDSIQELRAKAKNVGNLNSSDQQKVTETTVEGEKVIVIQPADPQVIYVPQQTTQVVYSEYQDTSDDFWMPVATFGLGMALGAAMNDDNDDHYYYGGGPWYGGMWGHNESVDHWVDRRHDSIDHALDNREERFDNRHERMSDRQDFRQDWAKNNPDKVNRENLSAAADKRSQQLSQARSSAQTRANDARSSAQSRTSTARSNAQTKYNVSGSRSFGGGSTWSQQGSSGYASRSASRGTMSRSSASRSFGSSGMSRGGGGFRGGGGSRGGGRR